MTATDEDLIAILENYKDGSYAHTQRGTVYVGEGIRTLDIKDLVRELQGHRAQGSVFNE